MNPQQPLTIAALATDFGVEAMLNTPPDASFIVSLLIYFGVLTLESVTPLGELTVAIPNQVIRSLYVEQIQKQLLNGYEDNNRRERVARLLYTEGDFTPMAAFIEERFYTALDNRDMRWSNELTLKMTLLILLTNDLYYIPRSELALGGGYSDLLLEVRPDKRAAQIFDLLFELKYLPLEKVKKSAVDLATLSRAELAELPEVAQALREAEQQLARYQAILYERYPAVAWNLQPFAMVTIGLRRLVWSTPRF